MGLTPRERNKPCLTRRQLVIGGGAALGLLLAIILICNMVGHDESEAVLVPPDPELPPPASWSKLRSFKRGAVCADSRTCAHIGKTMLARNGSAVDAALATLICNGLLNMQSMGFGGGFLMTVYEKKSNQAFVLNARDAAPAAAYVHMFDGKPKYASQAGGLSIAVPGELAGYWEAHQRFGKLPWADLFQPSIELCENGYNLTKIQYEGLNYNSSKILLDPALREVFVDPQTGQFYKPGTMISPKKLCETMKIIAEKNATELYNGTLGRMLVEDVQKRGSIITFKDLNDYRAKWEEPVSTKLYDGNKVYSTGVPGSGTLLLFILNVLDEFHFTPVDLVYTNSSVRTYHRIIETFKYAFSLRTNLGNNNSPKVNASSEIILSKIYAGAIKAMINDTKTSNNPADYGAHNTGNPTDHGTAHISVIGENGDAVSVTSSLNIYFGSGVMSERTGVLLNSAMDDFGIPGILNYFGLPADESNYIAPGKRPLSSMCPTIVVDKNENVKMTLGAAGGTKIITSVAYVIARYLWMGNTLKQAVDAPRIHHQLYPMEVAYEFGVPKPIVDGLKALGHKTSRYRDRGSVVCVLARSDNITYANADFRKGGDVAGLD